MIGLAIHDNNSDLVRETADVIKYHWLLILVTRALIRDGVI
jgi:phosphoribosyl-ATP pyrophosphohydrolase